MEDTKLRVQVVDVPKTATAAEAEVLLNEPHERGYYAVGVYQGQEPGSLRAVYRLRVRSEKALQNTDV